MDRVKELPKELFIEDDISCDLRKHNKKFYPIMKGNEQIGEFNFFKRGFHKPLTILLKDNLSKEDFIKSYQIFSNIFNKLQIESNQQIFLDYFTTSKKINKNLTRESKSGNNAIYDTMSDDRESLLKTTLHRNNNDFSGYFFRKNITGNFFLIEKDGKFFIINKKQKKDMLENNFSFNAIGCQVIPYQIDEHDKKIVDVNFLNPHTDGSLYFSLDETSGDKTLSYKTDKYFNRLIFINENDFVAPSIHIKDYKPKKDNEERNILSQKLEEISYHFMKNDFSEVKEDDKMIKNLVESAKDIPEVKIIKERKSNKSFMREKAQSIKEKEEEKPIEGFDRAIDDEFYHRDPGFDFDY